MATITTVSTNRVLIFPGLAQSVMLKITNDGNQTITGIKVLAEAYKEELGTGTGTVELGYIIGSDDEFGGASIRAGRSIEVPAYFTIGSLVTEEFGANVRTAPIHLTITVRYTDYPFRQTPVVLENALLLNHFYGPIIEDFELNRADDQYALNDEGEKLLTTLKLRLRDDMTSFMKLKLYWAENEPVTEQSSNMLDLTASVPTLLTGVTNNRTLVPGTFSNGSNWNFLLVFGDEYEKTSLHIDVSRVFANVHLSGEPEGGVCFGGFCKKTVDKDGNPEAKFESYYPAYFYGGIVVGGGGSDYSLEEQDTGGKWIDGKPIYRKVFTGTVKASTTTDIAINIGFETVIRCDGILSYVNSSGMTVQRSLNFFSSTSLHSRVYTGTSDGGKIQINSTQAGDVHVVLEYTKSTDAATTEVT